MGRFLTWTLVGFLIGFGFTTSLAFLLLPLGVIAIGILLARRIKGGGSGFGFIAGLGVTCLTLAALSVDYVPCGSAAGKTLIYEDSKVVGVEAHCGGIDPVPWSLAGFVLVGLGAAGYLAARRPSTSSTD